MLISYKNLKYLYSDLFFGEEERIMNLKTLILIAGYDRYFWHYIDLHTETYDIYVPYISYSTFFSHEYIRKHRKYNFVKIGKKTEWMHHLDEYNKVIIFEGAYSNEIGRILKKKKFEEGVFFVYWNYTDRAPYKQWDMINAIEKYIKIYSFNRTDCEKYNMYFNPVFYEPYSLNLTADVQYDIMFSGMIKHNRVDLLETTLRYIHAEDYKTLIDVWDTERGKTEYFEIGNKTTPYMDYLRMIEKSRCMLDLKDFIEDALSLRVLEAMFYHKKIITNSPYIKKEAFYHKNNIFILGEDHIDELKEFVFSPFDASIDAALADYRIVPWIERFV